MGARNRIGIGVIVPARQATYRLSELMPWNRFLGSLKSLKIRVQVLSSVKNESLNIVTELMENLWISRGTRAVFLDFTVYNANLNLFCVVSLLFEFPATGGTIPSGTFRCLRAKYFLGFFKLYFIQHCFLCRPSDSIVSEDAGIETRTVAT